MGSLDAGWKCSDFTLGADEKPWKVGGLFRALAFSGSAECLISCSLLASTSPALSSNLVLGSSRALCSVITVSMQ